MTAADVVGIVGAVGGVAAAFFAYLAWDAARAREPFRPSPVAHEVAVLTRTGPLPVTLDTVWVAHQRSLLSTDDRAEINGRRMKRYEFVVLLVGADIPAGEHLLVAFQRWPTKRARTWKPRSCRRLANSDVRHHEGERMADPDSLPTSSDLAGPCPRCGRISRFTRTGQLSLRDVTVGSLSHVGNVEMAHVLQCQGCADRTLVIETREGPTSAYTAVHWWPVPGAARLDASIPELVANAYDEGTRCVAVQAPHGAVTMLRSALAQIVLDKGSTAAQAKVKRNLSEGIRQWKDDGGLPESLADLADHARLVGNAGAHQEAYEALTMDEATDLQALVHQILQVVYVVAANIARARSKGTGGKRP